MTTNMITIDANEATALVAHKVNEVIAIYPITPSSGMGRSRAAIQMSRSAPTAPGCSQRQTCSRWGSSRVMASVRRPVSAVSPTRRRVGPPGSVPVRSGAAAR